MNSRKRLSIFAASMCVLLTFLGCVSSPRGVDRSRFKDNAAAAADAISFVIFDPGMDGGALWNSVDANGVDNEYSDYRIDCIWKTAFGNRQYFRDERLTSRQLEDWFREQSVLWSDDDVYGQMYLLRLLRRVRYAAPQIAFKNPHRQDVVGTLYDLFEKDTDQHWQTFELAWTREPDLEIRASILDCVPEGRESSALELARTWCGQYENGLDSAATEALHQSCAYLRLRAVPKSSQRIKAPRRARSSEIGRYRT